MVLEGSRGIIAPMKNPNAVALGRLGGLVGGPARAASLTSNRRSEIARLAVGARWSKARAAALANLGDRGVRIKVSREMSAHGIDPGVAEQVLYMSTLPAWERLARGLRRARLGQVRACF